METYELNYFNNEKNFEELQNVSDIYYETSLMDEDLQTQTMMRVENKQLKLVMKDRILNMLIKQLAESKSYAPATRTIQQLKEVGPISDKQVNELLFWYLDNDQISAASGQRSVLRPLFEKRRDGIHSNLLTMYDLYINRGF